MKLKNEVITINLIRNDYYNFYQNNRKVLIIFTI